VSVVVPLRNAERWIGDQLRALASQEYAGRWEVVVVDNGSTDGGPRIVQGFAGRLASLRIVDASRRRGINHARNVGAHAAHGDLLLFCDADDVVQPGWIAAMVAGATGADILGGRVCRDLLNDPRSRVWPPERQISRLTVAHGFLPYPPGGNLAVWTDVARRLGWDERFRYGSSDLEFGWRAQLIGHTVAFEHNAVVQQRLRIGLLAIARQQYLFGMSGAKLARAFRGWGMPVQDNRVVVRRWRWLLRNLPDLWRSSDLRGRWIRRAAFRAGRLAGSIGYRIAWL
jgi:glycosyltransferase involved in cell wall biosynthesis